MPIIQEQSYNIEFLVLESNNPKIIVLLDQSVYLTPPEKPLLFVTLPGYSGHIEIPYKPNEILVLNSDTLGLTDQCDYNDLKSLPDGVYTIRMGVCPYEDLNYTITYLKTTKFEQQLQNLLLTYEDCACIDYSTFKHSFIDIEILIQSAKAEANIGNITAATDKYKTALKKVNTLNRKLNCK